ncbi:MFS transporter [Caballeronia concitans]|uniref:Major facilitator transporter n=1 Tax=Caballeronia concitans TaxID=1777133 RepID=A0A658R1N4_9BURK|nr:MFS transporter [Caballeronia concitans]KIG08590.1 major facilitator superfamily MFS_1 [Burkholderia sp. MR1]SAL40210.1 major facilitator transporter [Caballeronia concitans]
MATPFSLTTPALDRAHRWKVLGVGVAANASFSAAVAGIPTTAVWLRSGYHLGNAELGLVLGALGLGAAVSELPWGVLTDRWGDRRVLLTGLVSTAIALIAMSLFVVPSMNGDAPALGWLLTGLCALGLLGGSVNGASGRAVMAWFAEGERGLAMSIRQTAVPLGGGIGAALLPWLASSIGFAAVFGALAAMCAISGAFTWRWLHEPPHAKQPHQHTRAAPLGDVLVWRMVLGIGVLCVPQFAVLTFATVFLHDAGRFGVTAISTTMGALQLGAMVMRVWSGRYTDRHGNRRAYLRVSTWIAVASFVALAAATAFGAARTPALLAAMIVLAGVCISAWHGVAYTELATLAGTARAGTALGMTNTAVYAGLFLTPIAIPHVLAAGSWTAVWLAAGVCASLALPWFPKPGRP